MSSITKDRLSDENVEVFKYAKIKKIFSSNDLANCINRLINELNIKYCC